MVLKKKPSKPKNVSALPAKEDFSVLDSAVSELAKQTEELLGKTGEKMSKPVLPKKQPRLNSKAKSFDIIHNADQKVRSESLLKAPHPGQKLLEADESENPKATDNNVVVKKTPEVESTAGLSAHTPGALKFAAEKTIEPIADDKNAIKSDLDSQSKKPADTDSTNKAEIDDEPNSTPEDLQVDIANQTPDVKTDKDAMNDEESKSDLEVNHKAEKELAEVSSDVSVIKPVNETDDKLENQVDLSNTDKTDSSQKVQLFSDNLNDSKSEDDDDDGAQPKIFDTDEYHPTLHDWSKLEHHSSAPKVVLLVLLVVLAAGVYIIVSGVKLPFLP
ncbi:hypothetical protein H6800_03580 [Candidatus Nomurabacteria bacterium]|nr:hypothetical protein [Candidatus Nomurabacteria bacterium]